MSKIKTKGNQVFNVPNDAEGVQFLKLCSKFLNRSRYKTVKRGRGKRTDLQALTCPLKLANWVALYIKGADVDQLRNMRYELERKTKDNDVAILKRKLEAAEGHARQIDNDRCIAWRNIQDLKESNAKLAREIRELKSQATTTEPVDTEDENAVNVTMVIDGTAIEITNAESVVVQK